MFLANGTRVREPLQAFANFANFVNFVNIEPNELWSILRSKFCQAPPPSFDSPSLLQQLGFESQPSSVFKLSQLHTTSSRVADRF